MITALGMMFLPLCIYFWQVEARLLELVFCGAVFSAGAVIVVGGYGIAPALVPTAIFVGVFMLKLCLGTRYPAEKTVLGVLIPFMAVVVGALLSSLVMPRLFGGEILVWPQKLAGFVELTPLAPNSGNYTQDMYLLANAALLVTASLYLPRHGLNLRRLLDVYLASGLLVVVISVWQFAGNTAHIWFPTDFFLSNPGWALLSDESVGTLTRISGPFSEPSSLAGYLCGSVSASAWMIFNGDRARMPRILLVCGLIVVLISTATTGYVTLAVMGTLLGIRTCLGAKPALRRRVALAAAAAAALAGVCVATVPVVAPGVAQEAMIVINGTLNKQQSSSYEDRTEADRDSVHEMEESYGLGVGWGSNRSSSLVPGLCASVGIWGILGLLWFMANIVLHVRIAQRVAVDESQRIVMYGCSAGLLGTLTSALVSGPTISSPDFYLLLALLIATGARARYDAYAQQSRARPSAGFGRFAGYKAPQAAKG